MVEKGCKGKGRMGPEVDGRVMRCVYLVVFVGSSWDSEACSST